MGMTSLPVPPLEDTLQRTLSAVAPLVDEATFERTRRAADVFRSGEGPRLQAALEEFARTENAQGRSWLSEEWLDGYLTVRSPLPLTTNVGFQITGDFGAPGPDRAAELVYRAAWVHLRQVRGETPQEVDPRGNDLCMSQWECLAGGIRHPRPERDEIRGPEGAALPSADEVVEIGVIHRGRLYALPVSTPDRHPLPLHTVAAGLRAVLERDDPQELELPFGALSYLGSGTAAPLLERLGADQHNVTVYRRISRMLFLVTLVEAGGEVMEHLRRCAFEVGHAWAYKPITYEVCLEDTWLAMHVEHSTVDGATILAVVKALQDVVIPDEPPVQDAAQPAALTWEIEPQLRDELTNEVERYRAQAAPLDVRRVFVSRPDASQLPFTISDDAAQQFIMLLAQLATYGTVRGTYEAVDMREYRAGRTECLRPVTPQATAFARALLVGHATEELFTEALEAHRGWVKACKNARGVDRHLLGLAMMARRSGRPCEFLDSPGIAALRHDFLSTTSIGSPDRIVRYAFAPATPEGFGIAYTRHPDGYEFCLSHHRDTGEDVDAFARNLSAGARTLRAFVGGLAR